MRLTNAIRRGLDHWTTVMSLLLDFPDDSELQGTSEEEREEMRLAYEWMLSKLKTDSDNHRP